MIKLFEFISSLKLAVILLVLLLVGLSAGTIVETRLGAETAGRQVYYAWWFLGLQGLLVTRSEKGMALFAHDQRHRAPWLIPTEAREVFDVSGAGDTVIAVFSAAISTGAGWQAAAMLAGEKTGTGSEPSCSWAKK